MVNEYGWWVPQESQERLTICQDDGAQKETPFVNAPPNWRAPVRMASCQKLASPPSYVYSSIRQS